MRSPIQLGKASRVCATKNTQPCLVAFSDLLREIFTSKIGHVVAIFGGAIELEVHSRSTNQKLQEKLGVRMNFMISRAELSALTGLGRTRTFALQKSGKLKTISHSTAKGWFELDQVLRCVAEIHQLPEPSAQCLEMHARLVIELRLKNTSKRDQQHHV